MMTMQKKIFMEALCRYCLISLVICCTHLDPERDLDLLPSGKGLADASEFIISCATSYQGLVLNSTEA